MTHLFTQADTSGRLGVTFQSGFVVANKDWGKTIYTEAFTRTDWLSGLSVCQLPMFLTLKKSGGVLAINYTSGVDMDN